MPIETIRFLKLASRGVRVCSLVASQIPLLEKSYSPRSMRLHPSAPTAWRVLAARSVLKYPPRACAHASSGLSYERSKGIGVLIQDSIRQKDVW